MCLTPRRINPADRKAAILSAALDLASRIGYRALTRDSVAEAARVSGGLVLRYYTSMDELRLAVLEEAVRQGLAAIVAEGLAAGEPAALAAPTELKMQAAVSLLGNGGA